MLNNEKGMTATVILLLIIPLILLGLVTVTEHARVTLGADVELQRAINDATRSASSCINPLSQAYNNPMIDPDDAYAVFRFELARNLRLDPDTLEPTAISGMKERPQIVFIVYNGVNSYGLVEGKKYPGGIEFNGNLPQDFVVTEDDIVLGGVGDIVTSLDKPGCIAVIKSPMKPFLSGDSTGVRWVATKVVKN